MNTLSKVVIFFLSLLSIVLLACLIVQLTEKRTYKCLNGTCSKSKNGDFSTMTACQTYCTNCEPPHHPPEFNPHSDTLSKEATKIRNALCPILNEQNKCQFMGCSWKGQNLIGPSPGPSP